MLKKVDHHIEAVRAWRQANKDLKHFAECCWHVDESDTKAVADDCKCSHDTVTNYRNAYGLYLDFGGDGYEPARNIWEEANIALWVKAARLRSSLELSNWKTWEYLQTAALEGMTREQLGAHVGEKENDTPHWLRRLRSVIRMLMPARADWKTELPPEKRARYEKAVAEFTAELKAIAED